MNAHVQPQQNVSTAIDAILAERSLMRFMKDAWPIIEPQQFLSNWHFDVMADHYQAVLDGEVRKLIVTIPPRHGKSLLGSVFLPGFTWAQDPDPYKAGHNFKVRPGTLRGPGVKFAYISYAQELSNDHSRKCRAVIESDWYQARWGHRLHIKPDANRVERFDTMEGGHRMALSFTGKLTGFGADIIFIDDAHNIREAESEPIRTKTCQTWDETLPSRRNNPKTCAFILNMQRSHESDLIGHILKRECGWIIAPEQPRTWTIVNLPARFEPDHPVPFATSVKKRLPNRKLGEVWEDVRAPGEPLWQSMYPGEALDELAQTMTPYAVAGQLQQRPAPREGGMFKSSWFEIVPAVPVSASVKVRAWDLAGTEKTIKNDPDWTVGLKMSRDPMTGLVYIENLFRDRLSPAEVERRILAIATQDGRGCMIRLPQDPGQAGKFQIAAITAKLIGFNVRSEREDGSKESRADPFAAQCEVGNVKLVQGPWNDAFLQELASFPRASHDDQVDAATAAFRCIADFASPTMVVGRTSSFR